MKIFERPLHNISTIDAGLVLWSIFWFIALIFLFFPSPSTGPGIATAIDFLFSFEFYETFNNEELFFIEQQNINNMYKALNVGKVIFWIMTIIMFLRFLFKEPNNE